MKRICLILCALILLCALPTGAMAEEVDGTMRVYLKSLGEIDRMTVTTRGVYSVDGLGTMRFANGTKMTIDAYEGELYLSIGGMTVNLGETFTLARHGNTGGVYIAGSQRGLLYQGDLELTARESGILPILVIGLEDYLMGVVPYEMSDSFPLEALKAQAVAARTYALKMRKSGASRGYDLVDTTADQVFMGYDESNINAIQACRETEGIVGMYKGEYATCYYTASNGGQTALPSDIWKGDGDFGYLSRRDDPYDLSNYRSVVKSAVIYPDGRGLSLSLREVLMAGASEALSAMGYSDEAEDLFLSRVLNVEPLEPAPEDSRRYTKLRFTYTMEARPLILVEPEEEEAQEAEAPAPAPGMAAAPAPDPAGEPTPEPTEEPPQYALGDLEPVEGEFTLDVAIFDDIKDGLELGINGGDYELFSVTVAYLPEEEPAEAETESGEDAEAEEEPEETPAAPEPESFTIEARRYGHGVGMSQRGAQVMAGVYGMTCEEILGFYYPGMELVTCQITHETRDVLPPLFGRTDELPELEDWERYGTVNVAGVSAALNVRSEPTTQSEVIALAYNGDRLIVGREVVAGWYEVRNSQLSGYVAAEYIILED